MTKQENIQLQVVINGLESHFKLLKRLAVSLHDGLPAGVDGDTFIPDCKLNMQVDESRIVDLAESYLFNALLELRSI